MVFILCFQLSHTLPKNEFQLRAHVSTLKNVVQTGARKRMWVLMNVEDDEGVDGAFPTANKKPT